MASPSYAVRSQLPYVIVYVTSSIDGKIASRTGDSRLSCIHDLRRLHGVRASCDAVMVGAGTVLVDDPLLTVRYVPGRNPTRVVIDGRLRIPLTARIVRDRSARTMVFTSKYASAEKVKELRNLGVYVELLEPISNSKYLIPLEEVMRTLKSKYSINKVLVEGGGNLLWSLFKSRLVDEVRLTIAPYVIGGERATSMVMGEGFGEKDEWVKLKLIEVIRCECGNEVHLRYLVIK